MVSRQRLHQLRFPERNAARLAVREAIKDGVLPAPSTLPCADCSQPATEYDHYRGYEYAYWLDVEAVCYACHVKRPKSPYYRPAQESPPCEPLPADTWLSVKQAATQYNISPRTLYTAIKRERIRYRRIGAQYVLAPEAIDHWRRFAQHTPGRPKKRAA